MACADTVVVFTIWARAVVCCFPIYKLINVMVFNCLFSSSLFLCQNGYDNYIKFLSGKLKSSKSHQAARPQGRKKNRVRRGCCGVLAACHACALLTLSSKTLSSVLSSYRRSERRWNRASKKKTDETADVRRRVLESALANFVSVKWFYLFLFTCCNVAKKKGSNVLFWLWIAWKNSTRFPRLSLCCWCPMSNRLHINSTLSCTSSFALTAKRILSGV